MIEELKEAIEVWAVTYRFKPYSPRTVYKCWVGDAKLAIEARAEAARLEVLGQDPKVVRGSIAWETETETDDKLIGRVAEIGGGVVIVAVNRDLLQYPERGTSVYIKGEKGWEKK